eukprot:TRINITY_DN10914_c0_g1_i1.p2 TRINITY_DN10914_c0_g1~~TRINITY_DN10914_c0_g1_i1.p2  ORF type:complete len:334 (+),score=130.95 TRINITY_DN10914_c0_g1_i1:93-1094(+)
MSKLSFDYSKWDRLELSDDEDSFHPNLDKNLNIRVNRITRDRKEEELDEEKKKAEAAGDMAAAAKVEQKRPLHVGNLCKVTEERTIINRSDGSRKDRHQQDGEEFSIDFYMQFKEDHKNLLEEFTNADWEKSHQMLLREGGILLDDCANNFFLLGALEAEMAGDKKRVEKLVRQGQIVSQIRQLAEPMKRPPRDLVPRFFQKFESGEAQGAFQEGVDHFMKHIKKRAVDKRKEQEQEAAEEAAAAAAAAGGGEEEQGEAVPLVEAMYSMSKEERMGPGGKDPVEVFEALPKELQECFRSGDIERLKQVAQSMDPKVFEEHFNNCIAAGLWKSS